MTVITGETGAGKTALLSALKLLVGERADASMVREGSDALVVEGRIFGPDDPDGHVVRRRVSADGRGRVSLDGHMASVRELAEGPGATVDLCGQHDHQKLLSEQNHLALLDAWATDAVAGKKSDYEVAWKARSRAQKEYDQAFQDCHQSVQAVDEARFVIERFEEVKPQEGEYEELQRSLPKMEHAESLLEACEQARQSISDEGGALDALNSALVSLESAERFDPDLAVICQALREAIFPIEDVAHEVRRYRDDVEFDPAEYARADARMGELAGLLRSYGPEMPDVFDRYAQACHVVELVDDSQEVLRRLQAALDDAEQALVSAAEALSQARCAAAPQFADAVSAQMARLEMGTSRLDVRIEELPRAQWGPRGADAVEFQYRPGAAMQPRPLARIASGGELSRVMLSIKVVLGARDDVETLIFDEIDAGVGGSTARAVAQVIAELAQTRQVIVVTHLAQLAVVAQSHYVVRKSETSDDGLPVTSLVEVSGEDRVREVARLLSGDEDEATIEHARVLLDKAGDR